MSTNVNAAVEITVTHMNDTWTLIELAPGDSWKRTAWGLVIHRASGNVRREIPWATIKHYDVDTSGNQTPSRGQPHKAVNYFVQAQNAPRWDNTAHRWEYPDGTLFPGHPVGAMCEHGWVPTMCPENGCENARPTRCAHNAKPGLCAVLTCLHHRIHAQAPEPPPLCEHSAAPGFCVVDGCAHHVPWLISGNDPRRRCEHGVLGDDQCGQCETASPC
jgi:hypothetical protein